MSDGNSEITAEAQADAYALPLETLHPAQADLFAANAMWSYFERLRAEAPVHIFSANNAGSGSKPVSCKI